MLYLQLAPTGYSVHNNQQAGKWLFLLCQYPQKLGWLGWLNRCTNPGSKVLMIWEACQ